MNYFPFHIGDYLSATRHLSWDEDAAYRRLLDAYYTSEKPLPADERQVFRLVVAASDAQREAVRSVLGEFFTLTADGWVNSRADREIEAMREKQQKQREKANKRWQKPSAEPGTASALPRHTEDDAAASETHADAMPPTPTPTPEEKDKDTAQAPAPRKRGVCVSAADMVAEGVGPAHARDWLQVRKAKDLPLTPTAWTNTKLEALKANLTPAQAVQMAAENGWGGFKAAWVGQARQTPADAQKTPQTPAWMAASQDYADAICGIRNDKPQPDTIDATSRFLD